MNERKQKTKENAGQELKAISKGYLTFIVCRDIVLMLGVEMVISIIPLSFSHSNYPFA